MILPDLSVAQWTGAALAAALVGLSKAGFGAGAGILAVPLMAAVLGPANMLPVMLLVLILGDIFSIVHYPREHDRRNLLMLLPGLLIGVACGALALDWFLSLPKAELYLRRLIGGLSVLFVGVQMYRLQRERRTGIDDPYVPRAWHGVGLGACAGLTSTLAHAGGPLIVLFLLPQKLQKSVFVGTVIKYFFVGNLVKVIAYQSQDLFRPDRLALGGALVPCVVVGTLLGVALHRRFSDRVFRWVIYVLAFLVGLYLLTGWEPGKTAEGAEGPEARFERATVAYREGRYGEAAEEFSALRDVLPESAAPELNAALAHYRAGEFAEAARAFRGLLEVEDRLVRLRATYGLGNCAYRRGDLPGAVAHYREAAAGCREALRQGGRGAEAEALAELLHRAEFNAALARRAMQTGGRPEQVSTGARSEETERSEDVPGTGEETFGEAGGEEAPAGAHGAAGGQDGSRRSVADILRESREGDTGPLLGKEPTGGPGAGPDW